MGKSGDKLYISQSEWQLFGGKKQESTETKQRIPFNYCSISLLPAENPVCDQDGNVFDLEHIIPFVQEHKRNPVTGQEMDLKELIKLNINRNNDGQYQCPITFKIFNDNSHIVCLKPTGNVFSWEAIEKLNIQPKFWRDLINDSPFTRKDIITLQDPHQFKSVSDFYYKQKNIPILKKKQVAMKVNEATQKILNKLDKTEKTESYVKKLEKSKNEAYYSTGVAAAALTSSHFTPKTNNESATITDEEYLFKTVKQKGTVSIKTNLGELLFELYCKEAPKTTYNFLKLCEKGFYNNIRFHRLIRNFMIQGGDPTGTGTGGTSLWGKPFEDEFNKHLHHTSRGILSMANKGKNTNTCQFFITFKATPHLDGKHTIFGKLVGGQRTLDLMENTGTNDKDEPVHQIVIESVDIVRDPFQEIIDQFDDDKQKQILLGQKRSEKVSCLKAVEEKGTLGASLWQDSR
ncbi:hypothetical protein EDD86DRAFT_195050 [Gorgonomyces haynaldii]|nr:hypothetical protein EDD86DRAFT_195050 [Gorgonomyces haynaldii]